MKKVIIILIALIALGGCKKNTNELIMVTEAGFACHYTKNGLRYMSVFQGSCRKCWLRK